MSNCRSKTILLQQFRRSRHTGNKDNMYRRYLHDSDGQTYFDGGTETVNPLRPIKTYINILH